MLRSSAAAASASRALRLIGASSRPLIFHPAIFSTRINPVRLFVVVSNPISGISMDQSRGYSSSRRAGAAASSSEDEEDVESDEDEDESENDDVDDIDEFDYLTKDKEYYTSDSD